MSNPERTASGEIHSVVRVTRIAGLTPVVATSLLRVPLTDRLGAERVS